MLRCPPSRITLTTADLHDFEQRFNARQTMRVPLPSQPNVRLSPGPSHHTKFAIISEDHNVGRKRAASSTSQATVCSAEDDASSDLPITFVSNSSEVWAVNTPTNVHDNAIDQTAIRKEAATALKNVVLDHQWPLTSPLANPANGLPPLEQPSKYNNPSPVEHSLRFTGAVLDGSVEIRPTASPAHERTTGDDLPRSRRGLPVLTEIHADAHPMSPSHHTEPPAFSSARARRRNARSHDVGLAEDAPELQHLIQSRHIARVPGRGLHADAHPPVPELVFPGAQPSLNPTLDPGAPVFVPRIRFGTVTSSSGDDTTPVTVAESQWSSMDSTHSSSNLRIRSSSEQNVDPPLRHRVNVSIQLQRSVHPAHRGPSRASEENEENEENAAPTHQPVANLERYPLLRPPSRAVPQRRNSGSHRPVVMPGRRNSRVPSTAALLQHTSPSLSTRSLASMQLDGLAEYTPPTRTASPAFSSSSRSTSNLLQPPISEAHLQGRATSVAWGRVVTPSTHRIPSMVSAASGISSVLSSEHSLVDSTSDAATEFLLMRNSPLDDLTERLSRISASRPRSVGRSWERPPARRPRISLLSGDPFRQDALPASLSSPTPAAPQAVTESTYEAADSRGSMPASIDSMPRQLPTVSSPTRTSSPALPSTPPVHLPDLSSPRQPLEQRSPAKVRETPGGAVKRKPVPGTPKVLVYNDAEPPNTQPQVPADIGRSTRRKRGRSDIVTQQGPSVGRRSVMRSPPTIPERHPHRNTYPSTTPSPPMAEGTASVAIPPTMITVVESARREHVRRRAGTLRSSEESENDLETPVHGLEEDRLTWLSRREEGSLDTTPPAEGRFERYLS